MKHPVVIGKKFFLKGRGAAAFVDTSDIRETDNKTVSREVGVTQIFSLCSYLYHGEASFLKGNLKM